MLCENVDATDDDMKWILVAAKKKIRKIEEAEGRDEKRPASSGPGTKLSPNQIRENSHV